MLCDMINTNYDKGKGLEDVIWGFLTLDNSIFNPLKWLLSYEGYVCHNMTLAISYERLFMHIYSSTWGEKGLVGGYNCL